MHDFAIELEKATSTPFSRQILSIIEIGLVNQLNHHQNKMHIIWLRHFNFMQIAWFISIDFRWNWIGSDDALSQAYERKRFGLRFYFNWTEHLSPVSSKKQQRTQNKSGETRKKAANFIKIIIYRRKYCKQKNGKRKVSVSERTNEREQQRKKNASK